LLTKLRGITEKKIALTGLLLALGLILIALYAFFSKGEKLSTFTSVGVIVDVQIHQGTTGIRKYLYISIPEEKGNIRISLPTNTPFHKGNSIKVICSRYTSGSISCGFVKVL